MKNIFRVVFVLFISLTTIAGLSLTLGASAPDFKAAKTNNALAGQILAGGTFQWTITISESDGVSGTFNTTEDILRDQLPLGPTYGPPIVGNINSITNFANISCAIDVNNLLTCEALGASVSIQANGSFTVTFDVTPLSPGSLNNPDGGICKVDPDNLVGENSEGNNDCTPTPDTVTVIPNTDLSAAKSNNVGSSLFIGQSFDWTITISNTQSPAAEFANTETILIDNLPNGNTVYGAPVVQNDTNITGLNFVDCQIVNNLLTCTASGGTVTIGSFTGSFDVVFAVTPANIGAFTNPTGGVCQVDPNDLITESDETNNDCIDTLQVNSLSKLATPVTINLTSSFAVPFWCGERKEIFTMDGDTFTKLEQFDTEIEVILPQKRILLIFPAPQETANLIESATITEPSNFETPGTMTIPIRARINSSKTLRISCRDLLALPTELDGAGEIIEALFNALFGIEYYHGVLTIESDKRDMKIFVNKIVRSWSCVDQGSGLDCLEGQMDMTREEISRVSISARRVIGFEVRQVGFAPTSTVSSPSVSIRDLSVRASSISAGRAINFSVQGSVSQQIEVDVHNLSGKQVFTQSARGNSLRWNLRDESGRQVANGVYLYRVIARGLDGRVMKSEIKKFVVLR
jgi:hypothetical protein